MRGDTIYCLARNSKSSSGLSREIFLRDFVDDACASRSNTRDGPGMHLLRSSFSVARGYVQPVGFWDRRRSLHQATRRLVMDLYSLLRRCAGLRATDRFASRPEKYRLQMEALEE